MKALVVMLLLLASPAFAQSPAPQANRTETLEQLARDLRDYRTYLEDQLAAAKVVIADLQRKLDLCESKVPRIESKPVESKP